MVAISSDRTKPSPSASQVLRLAPEAAATMSRVTYSKAISAPASAGAGWRWKTPPKIRNPRRAAGPAPEARSVLPSLGGEGSVERTGARAVPRGAVGRYGRSRPADRPAARSRAAGGETVFRDQRAPVRAFGHREDLLARGGQQADRGGSRRCRRSRRAAPPRPRRPPRGRSTEGSSAGVPACAGSAGRCFGRSPSRCAMRRLSRTISSRSSVSVSLCGWRNCLARSISAAASSPNPFGQRVVRRRDLLDGQQLERLELGGAGRR